MIRDFARDGQLHGSYGDAELTTRLRAGPAAPPAPVQYAASEYGRTPPTLNL